MKNNESSLFVFIATIIVGILISLNINFNKTYNRVFLSTKQYQDAYSQRNKLRGDISSLQDEYAELNKKLNSFQNEGHGHSSISNVSNEIEDELSKNKMVLGTVDVEGEGIIITLKDISNDIYFYSEDDPNLMDKIIHNIDIVNLINDLKMAGAEAISINGQRVNDRTSVICDGSLLEVNGVKIASPFNINAIGNKESLKTYMLADDNYLKYMISREIYVDISESDNVKIQAYPFDMNDEFLKTVK
ncbi:hypothetical protein HMPREF1982_03252 [Clostridiales bacterium oral taxon 876 str. F0540]|nr:hypothetical protein HMPREF1982_03252 [Clostridiales bacterium oral taxon 876 str. F0540]